MSPESDRIAVPTNGKGPHPVADPVVVSPAPPGTSDEELSVAFTPRQLAIGFGILASLLLLLAGRARRGRDRG